MQWLKRIFGGSGAAGIQSQTRTVTVKNPLIIRSPKLGFLNLIGAAASAAIEQDKKDLSPLFTSVEESDSIPPHCDVLMVYAQIGGDGRIANSTLSLREIIRDARAPIAIVAWENEGPSYIAAGKNAGYGQANLVMTLKRKGPAFGEFFRQLFSRMHAGETMVLAWVKLAPQNPHPRHDHCPETIFAAEISHIVFSR